MAGFRVRISRPGPIVPTDEAWLWNNKEALTLVLEGLDQAGRRRQVAGPNLTAARKLASRIQSRIPTTRRTSRV
jgi:hypothetical protein